MFDGERTLTPGSGAGSGPAAGSGGVVSTNRAVMRITAMAPDQESKLLAFMRWAGPIMLAALGMNPSACAKCIGREVTQCVTNRIGCRKQIRLRLLAYNTCKCSIC